MQSKLSTESLARSCAHHPRKTILIWTLLVIVTLALTFIFLQNALTDQIRFTNHPESERGLNLLEDRLRGPTHVNEFVIIQSETMTVDDDTFQTYVENIYSDVMTLGSEVIEGGFHYYLVGDDSLISENRHITIIPITMAGDIEDASDNIGEVLKTIQDNRESEFEVFITGGASIGHDFNQVAERDLQTGEIIGIPIAIMVLILVFGALSAAIVPLVLALVSIAVAIGLTALVGQVFELSFFVVNMIMMMGLAVGIDYSLFIVSRYREERKRGLARIDAISTTGATSGRAMFFSGVTVILAIIGMLLVPSTLFHSLATGAILVVIAAVMAALTLLPAILSLMGDKVNAWRLPLIQKQRVISEDTDQKGFWVWVTHAVMRRSVISLILAVTILIIAALPLLSIEIGAMGVGSLPNDEQSKKGFLILDEEFMAGDINPVEIVIDGSVEDDSVQKAIKNLQAIFASDPIFGPSQVEINPEGNLALLSVPVAGEALGETAVKTVRKMRSEYIPEAFSGTDVDVMVTGQTASNIDYFDQTTNYMPVVMIFVLSMSFLLLTLVFRSIILPIKAIVMNLLSVGAAYGLIVLFFTNQTLADLMGFRHADIVEAWVPLFLFAVLFGLSMDYHVFLLSRIRERFDQTQNNTESVAYGLRTTGRIITGAALIMVAVFFGFAQGDLVMFQQMGFGLGLAVLIDATIIRSVLVPAGMKLLGRWNWYLPGWLEWLPQINVGEEQQDQITT